MLGRIRHERSEGPPDVERHTRFRLHRRHGLIGTEFWIESDGGQRAYKVRGSILEDADGHEIARIHEQIARIKESVQVSDPNGRRLATVKMAVPNPVHERWVVTIGNGPELDVVGDILGHEYTVTDGRTRAASVSTQNPSVADTCLVEVGAGQDPALMVATVVAIDRLVAARHRSSRTQNPPDTDNSTQS